MSRDAVRRRYASIALLACFAAFSGRAAGQSVAEARQTGLQAKGTAMTLRGVVTAFSGWHNSFFLQDSTGGISVDRREDTPVRAGDEVEVRGSVRAGLFANVFLSEQTLVLRHTSLPQPRAVSYREMETGKYDSRLVAVNGRVQAVRLGEMWGRKILFVDLQTGNAALTIYMPNWAAGSAAHLPDYLVDSEVRVSGVCGTIFNDRRQLIGLRLFVGAPEQIQVLVKGRDAALIPISPLSSLLTLDGPLRDQRVHVKGTVTYSAPGQDTFLEEGRAVVRVSNPDGGNPPVGSEVEAWGFLAGDGYSPVLEHAFLRVAGGGQPVQPIQIKASDVIKIENGFTQAPSDGLLVQLEARIVDRLPNNSGSLIWTLAADGVEFQAQITAAPRKWSIDFESGERVNLTGICIAETDTGRRLNSFHILLRSPADMQVVRSPYWNGSLLLLLGTYSLIVLLGVTLYLMRLRDGLEESDPRLERNCQRVSKTLALLTTSLAVGIIGAAKYTGPNPGIALLRIGASGWVSGPVLLAAGVAVYLQNRRRSPAAIAALRICMGFVIVTGVLALAAGFSNGQIFPAGSEWFGAERVPQATALSLVLIGCANLFVSLRRSSATVGQLLAVMVEFTTSLKLVSSLYGTQSLKGLSVHLIMSTPCAVALLGLSIATLLAAPGRGVMRTFCSPRLGGFMLRRLAPGAVLVPLAVGWLRLQLQIFGFLDTRLGLTLFALSIAFLFCFLMWASAMVLNRLDRLKSGTEDQLRERQRKLDLIFDTGSIGDFTWGAARNEVFAHSSIWRLYGEPERLSSEPVEWFSGRQHPDDRARIAEELNRVETERRPFDLEFRVVWPDGSIHWLYCRAFAEFGADGKITQTSGINLDITDRKAAEQRLRESELLFRELADAMPQIVWTADKNGAIQHYNQRWYNYTELHPGDGWQKVVPEDDFAVISAKWMSSIASGVEYENEILLRRASDGSYRWHLVRAVPIYSNEGEVERWFGTCTDIDDFKLASNELAALNESLERRVEERSRQLAQAEGKYRLLIESVKDYAIYMLDGDGNVTSWNVGAERLKGYTAAEVIGRHYSVFYTAEDCEQGDPELHLAQAVAEGRIFREAERVRKDGSRFWASILISPIYDGNGQVCGFSKVVRDITDWRRATELLIAAQKRAQEANMAKSSFLAAMSHEIRTPMNAILGMADLLWETELNTVQREYVGRFRRAGANLLTLINDILDLSKIESGRFDLEAIHFDLFELVDRVMELASSKAALKKLNLETQVVPETPAFLIGDPVRLQQILNNLIGNAIKFTPGGRIVLRIAPHADGKAGHLEFSVSDTGIGIPENKLNAVFEDFTQAESSTTRRFGGTGLGLGICRRLVRKMLGELTVESVQGQGSTFRFDARLTVSPMVAEALAPTVANLSGQLALVVDDNATNRMIICEMCASWGMKTRSAVSAEQALEMVAAAQGSDDRFSLVVLDGVLPGVTGLETLQSIKRLDPKVAVIISSSDSQPGEITEAQSMGAAAYLIKPVRRAELLSCIVAALSSGKPAKPMVTEVEGAANDQEREELTALKILLAEDSEDNRFLVEAYLAGKPYELSFAENGQQAVAAFVSGQFDVILMDIQMPVMDGLTATARIREIERELSRNPTVIMALTANALVEDTQRSLEAGCDAHLPKPISKDRLIAAIESFRERLQNEGVISGAGGDAPGKPTAGYVINIPAGFEALSRIYIKTQLEGIQQIRSSLADRSLDQLRTVGHNMKGSGVSYGFPNLSALGAAIEDAAKSADLKQLEKQVTSVERYLRYATDYLCEELVKA